jgi:hypothetical protein
MAELAEIEADPANAAKGDFTTQFEPPPTPKTSAEPGETATPKRKRSRGATSGARASATSYVLLGLLALGLLGCVAPLAGIGVYYLVFAGGRGPGPGGADPEVAAPEKKAPPAPTGEVPAGWVVVTSPRSTCTVAMPQKPMTQTRNGVLIHTVQLPNGLPLTNIVQPMHAAQIAQAGGPDGALDQFMLALLLNAGGLRPGGRIPDSTRITLGPWPGRESRLPSKSMNVSRAYVGIQMDTVPGGARVVSVTPNAPADRAGLKANDIVYEAGGRLITDHQMLFNTIQSSKVGEAMLYKVQRGQEKLELKVTADPIAGGDQYIRAYLIKDQLVMLLGPAQGDGPAPETAALFKSLQLGGGAPDAEAEAKLPVHEVGKGLELKGQLDGNTGELVYRVKLLAGTTYVIDMVSPNQPALDPYLVLTDAAGKHLAEDDDSGGGLNARIFFRPEQSGTFRIVATYFIPGTGAFTLTVRDSADPPK